MADEDALDSIADEVRRRHPDLDLDGLAITGRIMRLARHLEARRERQLAAFDLTVADFDVLATMRRRASEQPINVRELQRSLMLSSGGMTKRLDRLETAGLIQRLRDPNDRRGVLLELSAAGVRLIDDAVPAVLAAEADLVHNVIPATSTRSRTEAGLRHLLVHMDTTTEPGS